MKAFLTALITCLLMGLGGIVSAQAANPLTPAEQRVCRSLKHCLDIVDTHPHDAFDYDVLADEFRRFGPKGRDALLNRIKKNDISSSNAADLLALTRDASAIPRLNTLAQRSNNVVNGLAERTEQALRARMRLFETPMAPPDTFHGLFVEDRCFRDFPASFGARKMEMPFFEQNIATPDVYGAFRPSAKYRFEPRNEFYTEPYMSRAWLRAAIPVPGGWYAAYPNGLVFYDNSTGAPDIRAHGCMISLQSRDANSLSPYIWAFYDTANGNTAILDIGPNMSKRAARLTGRLSNIERQPNGALCATASDNSSVTLSPDGSTSLGCKANTP